jgi:hypothetical protein
MGEQNNWCGFYEVALMTTKNRLWLKSGRPDTLNRDPRRVGFAPGMQDVNIH